MRTEEVFETAWMDQPGRITSRLTSVADGFRGRGSLASLAVVVEDQSLGRKDIQDWISALRDNFSGGVAYGVGDLLFEALKDLCSDGENCPKSLAAAAILGREVWVYATGQCLAMHCNVQDEEIIRVLEPGIPHHLELAHGSVVLLVSHGLKRLASSPSIALRFFGPSIPLEAGLRNMVDDTRIRFRILGGSAAVLRHCRKRSSRLKVMLHRRLLWISCLLALLIVSLLLLCRSRGHGIELSPEGPSLQEDMVQQLN